MSQETLPRSLHSRTGLPIVSFRPIKRSFLSTVEISIKKPKVALQTQGPTVDVSGLRVRALDFLKSLTIVGCEAVAEDVDMHMHKIWAYARGSATIVPRDGPLARIALLFDQYINRRRKIGPTDEPDRDQCRRQITNFLRKYSQSCNRASFARGVLMSEDLFNDFMSSKCDSRFLDSEWDGHWADICPMLSASEDSPLHARLLISQAVLRVNTAAEVDQSLVDLAKELVAPCKDGFTLRLYRHPVDGVTGVVEVDALCAQCGKE